MDRSSEEIRTFPGWQIKPAQEQTDQNLAWQPRAAARLSIATKKLFKERLKPWLPAPCERTLGCPGHSEEIHTFPGAQPAAASKKPQCVNDGGHRRDARPAGADRQIEGAPVRQQGRRLPRDGRRPRLRGLPRPRHPRLRRADAQITVRARRAGGAARRRARGPRRLRDLS